MKTPRRPLGLILALLLLAFAPARAEMLMDDTGRFAVDIPQPVTRSTTESGAPGNKVTNFVLTHDGGNVAQMVQYTDFPAGQLARVDLATLYNGAAKGGAANVNGTIRTLVVHTLGNIEGREMIVDFVANEQKCVCRCRFYVVTDRLYALLYVGLAGSESNADVLHFLDSFRVMR